MTTDEGAVRASFFNFRNTIVLLGIIITTIGLVYFANEFAGVISDWGRVLDFLLLTVVYTSLGFHFSAMESTPELMHARGWRWLRTTTAFYILGLVSGGASVVAFLAVDEIDRAIKLLVIVGLGLGLILVAATKRSEISRKL